MLCKDTFIHHFGSVSFKKDNDSFSGLIETNLKKFEIKWGFNPNYSFFMRNDIIEMMSKPKNQKINILELGCACGDTLLKTKNLFCNAALYGIEINKNAAAIASNFADIKIGNIENINPDYSENFFDYIIMADVLEHTLEPRQILTKFNKFLKDDGEILASIPNIMHFSVIKELIQGRFQYREAGILDKTHLRFFTLHEIKEMFMSCGYNIAELKMVFLKTGDEDNAFIENLCKLSNKNLFEQYEAYQYLIKAQKLLYN